MSRIFRTFRTWRGGGLYAGLLAGVTALAMLPVTTSAQSISEKKQMQKDRMSLFNLAAGPSANLNVNRLQCGATSEGETCVDTFGSPTGGGGFWPAGSPNQYMFSSGLQVAGIIPAAAGCTTTSRLKSNTPTCFHWSGDTTAALFFEGTGARHHGTPVTQFYNSLDPNDLAIWPTPGSVPDFPEATSMIINDTSLFNDVLIGRKAASQQDSWVAYWDGDPNKSGGRTHPMGILAEQRTLAWNYPDGNEASLYVIYRLTNVTNNRLFQTVNETRYFGGLDSLPDAGWTFDSLFVAYDSDPDVGPATNNYHSGVLPFSMAIAYEKSFNDPAFIYPPDIFHAPFFLRSPGIVAMKFLRSPINPATGQQLGLTGLSGHTNGGAFSDPGTVQKAWRYLSLNIDPSKGDQNCTIPLAQIKTKRFCFLAQTSADVRVFLASGPMSLAPGQSATIAVAIFAAAAVQTPLIQTSPTSDNIPGLPGLAPGCGTQPIRPIEVASGWVSSRNCPTDTVTPIKQTDVTVVPGSLLGRALVAQSIFDNKFLLGFAPEPPEFFLVPGNNQITVVWEPSRTDVAGDPFFSAAGNPSNALFDPNYRKFDVEGYRIYRGNTPSQLNLIAQFDKTGTTFIDVTCATDVAHVTGSACTGTRTTDLNGDFVQAKTVATLSNGDPILLEADTALAAEIANGTSKGLSNTGIPYAFIDTQVRNGFQYFYKVTAFDINSLKSGPTSLESAGPTKSAIPQAATPSLTLASLQTAMLGSGVALNPNAPLPKIDAANGTFSGPQPPTNGIVGALAPVVERLLPAFNITVTIDSVLPDHSAAATSAACPNGRSIQLGCFHMFLTIDNSGVKTQQRVDNFVEAWSAFAGSSTAIRSAILAQTTIHPDAASAALFGITANNVNFTAQVDGKFQEEIGHSQNELQLNRRALTGGSTSGEIALPGNTVAGGSRWFSGAVETVADPARLYRVGHLDGVDTVWSPIGFTPQTPGAAANTTTFLGQTAMQCIAYHTGQVARSADIELTWNNGTVTAKDLSNNVPVDFKPTIQASFGFLNTDANGNGKIDYGDFHYVSNISAAMQAIGFCNHTDVVAQRVNLEATPVIKPVSTSGFNNTAAILPTFPTTGNGFGMYINGQTFIFQLSTLPANGTKWTFRTYTGFVTSASASMTSLDPSGYAYNGVSASGINFIRNPMVPHLQIQLKADAATSIVAANEDLKRVHTVPDPYYGVSLFDLGPANKELQFVNLPPQATIRIYSLAGILVDVITHNDPSGGGAAKWDLRNRSNQFVASGVYYFHVSTPDGKSNIGKFTVVSSGLGQ